MEIVINYLFVIVSLLGGGQTEVKHSAVGSRSLVVCNHQNKPEVLQLALKECNCGLAEQNPFDPCHCWGNFSKDDLPSVQGDPRIFIFYFLISYSQT